uniref:Phospholipase A2 n=1 Tax=Pygocentrus nattereri TaxID=42514 RepID=A0AAR2LI05_PYGNA
QKEVVPHWNLSVKVLRGKFRYSHDYLSESDLYVTLRLPTASARTLRTRCIPNNNKPQWNETFHFRVHGQVKVSQRFSLDNRQVLLMVLFIYSWLNNLLHTIVDALGGVMMMMMMCLCVCSSEKDLSVRLDFDISEAEKVFLMKRKEVASRALKRALNLNTNPDPSRVPTVAVVCSGGGTRAMTCTLGSLRGLQKLGLLDTVSYITAVSGATWAVSSLYGDPGWSVKKMDEGMLSVQKELSKSMSSLFSPRLLQYYSSELEQREREGHPVSLIDMWGLFLEQLIFGKKKACTLSDQQRAVSEGQNPLPIYTAVNTKQDASVSMMAEWCEFTPFEVGFPKYGGFIPAENFGSEYYLGHLIKKLPETRISFLLEFECTGLCGSQRPPFIYLTLSKEPLKRDHKPATLDTLRVSPEAVVLSSFMNSRPVISKAFNFLRGFFLHNCYSEHSTFTSWKDTHLDAFPNKLTPMDSRLGLVDSGFAINAGFPPVLRSHRRADVILSLNYSWDSDQFKVLKQTQQYCTDHQVAFPKIDFNKVASELQREVYVFEDEDNPEAPIVLHFPLTNVSFRQYKTPVTKNLTYAPQDFQRLTDLASYNILNNRDIITRALQKALHRKRLITFNFAG